MRHHNQRGDVSVFLALILMATMLSSAIVFSLILARQIRATEDAVASERAFYAANSGLEHELYILSTNYFTEETLLDGTLEYTVPEGDAAEATYTGKGKYNAATGTSCVVMKGTFRNESRRLQLGPADCLTP